MWDLKNASKNKEMSFEMKKNNDELWKSLCFCCIVATNLYQWLWHMINVVQ